MGLVEAILQGSSLVQERVAEGHAEGEAKGRAEEARRLLRKSLLAAHAGLESMPEIDSIASPEAMEAILIEQVLRGASRDEVAGAIRSAAKPPGA